MAQWKPQVSGRCRASLALAVTWALEVRDQCWDVLMALLCQLSAALISLKMRGRQVVG